MSTTRQHSQRQLLARTLGFGCLTLLFLLSILVLSDDLETPELIWQPLSSELVDPGLDHGLEQLSIIPAPESDLTILLPPICQDVRDGPNRENATILILARNGNAYELARTLRNFELTFNARFRYPYTILNDMPFTGSFKETIIASLPTGAAVEFAEIPSEHWGIPDWLDKNQIRRGFQSLEEAGVMYGGIESYHNMCRYFSGLFALHLALNKYRYYWRLEPNVHFYCQTTYDPFQYLRESKKVYGFNMALYETHNTIPSLFKAVTEWRDNQVDPQGTIAEHSIWRFMTEGADVEAPDRLETEESYNDCHFWTNFELGDLDFFRGEEYQSLFNHLDHGGGFFTERWGDAPVRSLALGLLAEKNQIHYFEDIAYQHWPYLHYPNDEKLLCKCEAPPQNMINSDYHNLALHKGKTCMQRWKAL